MRKRKSKEKSLFDICICLAPILLQLVNSLFSARACQHRSGAVVEGVP